MDRSHDYDDIVNVVDEFCDEHFTEERIQQWIISRGIPRSVYQAFYESELGPYCLSPNAGGIVCSFAERAVLIGRMSRRAGATLPFLTDMICMALLSTMSSNSQGELVQALTQRWGHVTFSQAFSEDGAGSNASAVKTSVTLDNDTILLNGRKTFVANGQFASDTLVLVRDPLFGSEDGDMSLWLVPLDTPGVSTFPLNTLGQEMLSPATVQFDDVVLDPDWRIQSQGELKQMLRRQYELGRILVCASSWGLARAAMDDALLHASRHEVNDQVLGGLPQIQEKLADMEIKLRSMSGLILDAANDVDGKKVGPHVSCALMKRFVPQAATEVASSALQIYGGVGYTDQTRIGRIWNDCRGNQIAQGTDEIMAGIAAKMLLSEQHA